MNVAELQNFVLNRHYERVKMLDGMIYASGVALRGREAALKQHIDLSDRSKEELYNWIQELQQQADVVLSLLSYLKTAVQNSQPFLQALVANVGVVGAAYRRMAMLAKRRPMLDPNNVIFGNTLNQIAILQSELDQAVAIANSLKSQSQVQQNYERSRAGGAPVFVTRYKYANRY